MAEPARKFEEEAAIYREAPAASAMANQACTFVGGNQPHNNMQPYLCINFIISLFGVYPSQT